MGNKSINIDLSSASVINISGIYSNENIVLTATNNTENWTGTYEFNIYFDFSRETKLDITGNISIIDNQMLLIINPESQNLLSQNTFYYQVFNSLTKRVEFLGTIKID